jgi:CRISPR/Cas system-associated exonuclease Cas4 (RecB family)
VKGEGKLPSEAAKYFQAEFDQLRKLYLANKVTLEQECALTDTWEYVDEWNDEAWCLIKMDSEIYTPSLGIIIDYKTGKRRYNEVKHAEQMQLYQLAFWRKRPDLQRLRTEIWYLDLPPGQNVYAMSYTRKQGEKFQPGLNRRARKMLNDKKMSPTPNTFVCRWCPYHPERGTGHCKVGV